MKLEKDHGKEAGQDILYEAILEADLLLAHASSHGVKVDEDTLRDIVESKKLLEMDPMDEKTMDLQIVFWKARGILAHAVHPISADSLKMCTLATPESSWIPKWLAPYLGLEGRYSTGVQRVIRTMQIGLLIPITVLLALQIYVLIGASTVGNLKPIMEKMEGYLTEKEKLVNAEKSPGNAEALKDLGRKIEVARVETDIRIHMLRNWNSGWGWITAPFQNNSVVVDAKTRAAESSETDYHFNRASVLKAEFALDVIKNFLLPLLYGCLGASLFVLRNLASDAKNNTLDMERKMSYNLRIYMGALCGLVIGWLIPDKAAQESDMTPYTLSILGGYSVDIVFGLMDKIISNFSTPSATKSENEK